MLDDLREIKICTAYRLGDELIGEFPTENKILYEVEPVYETMEGWMTETRGIKDFDALPENAKRYIRRLSEILGVEVVMVSVGAKRKEAILLKNPFS